MSHRMSRMTVARPSPNEQLTFLAPSVGFGSLSFGAGGEKAAQGGEGRAGGLWGGVVGGGGGGGGGALGAELLVGGFGGAGMLLFVFWAGGRRGWF